MDEVFVDDITCGKSLTLQIIEMLVIGLSVVVISTLCMLGTRGLIQYRQENVKTPFLLKYIFYSCIIMAMSQSVLFIVSLLMCYDQHFALLSSFILYGVIIIHLFWLWLFRLYNTFNRSAYAKSNRFYILTISTFVTLILFAISGGILFIFDLHFAGVTFMLLSAFGYMFMSTWLMNIFARQLLELITCRIATMRFRTEATLRRNTSSLELSSRDQRLVQCITKYLVLGISSLTFTLLVLFVALVDLIAIFAFGSIQKWIITVLTVLIVIDVMSNILCVYLQFNFAKSSYMYLCDWFDKRINKKVEKIAVVLLRTKTYSFYAEKFNITPVQESHGLDEEDDVEKVPTFSSQMPQMHQLTSASVSPVVSPATSNASPNDTDEDRKKDPMLDFDKLINYRALSINQQQSDGTESNTVNDDNNNSAVQSEVIISYQE